jgi:hypothetical protein
MAAVRAATTCCGSIAAAALRGPSLTVVAALPTARDALDERRLGGMAASDLNTLAGARGGRSAPPCEHEVEKIKLTPLETECLEERWPTSGWRRPASSSSRARRALRTRPTPPPSRLRTPLRHASAPLRRADTSAACAASSIDCPAAGAPEPAPGTCFSATSAALGEGAQAPTSQGGLPPVAFLFFPDDEYSGVAGGESPCCSRSRNSSSICSRRSRRRIPRSFFRAARSCSRR